MAFLMSAGNPKLVIQSIYKKLFSEQQPKQPAGSSPAKRENLSEQFRFKLSTTSKAKLELISAATKRSQSSIIREGIEAFSSVLAGKNEIVIGGKLYTKATKIKAKRVSK